jgi:hypothetical protein
LFAVGDDASREHRPDTGQAIELIGRPDIDVDLRRR